MRYKQNGHRMTLHPASLIDPGQLLGAAHTLPVVSLVLAAIIVGGIALLSREPARRRGRVRLAPSAAAGVVSRYTPEHRVLGITAIAVILAFTVEDVVTGYFLDLYNVVSWWRYATPLFTAAVGLAVLLVFVVGRGSTPPERPVLPAVRRTWRSFSSRVGSAGAAIALFALTATTVAAGLASSNIGDGPYVYLEIGVPNEAIDPIRPWFYGWAYGIPVLLCIVALVGLAVGALQASSARAFLRPETVVAEQRERRDLATGIARIVTASALLALAGAWRFIADAGSVSGLTVMGDGGDDSYEAFWRYGEIAAVGGWLAPVLEIAAFVLLLLVTAQLRPFTYGAGSAESVEATADSGAAR